MGGGIKKSFQRCKENGVSKVDSFFKSIKMQKKPATW
jgi:hypothetical protein